MNNTTLFDGVYYINLKYRIDRKKQIEKELNNFHIKYERFDAIKHDIGIIGCGLSHLAVLEKAKELNLKNVLIFEDDFKFIVDENTFWNEMNKFFNKNIDYDVVFPSYNLLESQPYDDQLFKVLNSQSASCYIVNGKYLDKLINTMKEGVLLLKQTGEHWNYANDQYWKKLQPNDNWYAFNIRIGKQRTSYSDCANTIMEYNC